MFVKLRSPTGVKLRSAGRDDFSFAERLYVESTNPLLKAIGRWDAAAVAQRFSDGFRRGPSQIVCIDGKDIGWLQVSRRDASIHLHQVQLIKAFRNRGIGTELIRSVMAEAKRLDLPLTLNVIRGNPAIELYRRLGFRVVSEDAELLKMQWDPSACAEP